MAFHAKTHPRLYLDAEDVPHLRKRCEAGLRARILSALTKRCDALLDPRSPDFFDHRERKKDFWGARHGIWTCTESLRHLAWAYLLTGRTEYGEAARDSVLGIIRDGLADRKDVGHGNPTHGWRRGMGHDKGLYARSTATVFDLCYDLFSDDQRETFAAHALESMRILEDELLWRKDLEQIQNNRGARAFMGCMGFYPLLLEGDVPESAFEGGLGEKENLETRLEKAAYAAEVFLHCAFAPDGACFEGPGYGGALDYVRAFALALARSGRRNLLANRRFETFLHHQVAEIMPGGGSINDLNDCHSPCGTVAPSLHLMGKDEAAIIPWLATQLDLHPARGQSTGADSPLLSIRFMESALLHWNDAIPVRTPEELGYPKSTLSPIRGIASMRTGWEKDDWLLSHHAGYEMHKMHHQGDQNHVALYALGERFLVDEGYGNAATRGADMRQAPNRYFGCGDVHNTILIDGKDQHGHHLHRGCAEGQIVDWQEEETFTSSMGDASGAYGLDHTIHTALRRVLFVHAAAQPFVLIFDRMRVDASESSHLFEILWRTDIANRITPNGNAFRIRGRRNDCLGEVLLPQEASLSVAEHYGKPRLCVAVRTHHLEAATLFMPSARGAEPPQVECRHAGEHTFDISLKLPDETWRIRAGTAQSGPLRSALPATVKRVG